MRLLQHQQELQAVLEIENIDVCLISETHFTKQSYIKFRGYRVYHTSHPENSAKGGSAIIVKENIIHFEEEKYQTEEIQATTIQIKTKNYYIVIAGLYCPPKHSLKKTNTSIFLNDWGKDLYWGETLMQRTPIGDQD